MRSVKITMGLTGIALLAACSGEPEWVEVYEQCKENVAVQSEELKKSVDSTANAQNRAMAESMGNMAISMAMSACEMIRTNCEADEEGPACKAYIAQAQKN